LLDEWRLLPKQTGGKCAPIDQNVLIERPVTPIDRKILSLNGDLNRSYVIFNAEGVKKKAAMLELDLKFAKMGGDMTVQRIITKASQNYFNPSWDLVDASNNESFDYSKVDKALLPPLMQRMNEGQIRKYAKILKLQREVSQTEILFKADERRELINQMKAKNEIKVRSFGQAVVEVVEQQMRK
jgi:hypothetical protein